MRQSDSMNSIHEGDSRWTLPTAPPLLFYVLSLLLIVLPRANPFAAEPAAKADPSSWVSISLLQDAADAVNAFALDIFLPLASEDSGNLVVSPYSLHNVLAMAAYGARGETRDELLDALNMGRRYPYRNQNNQHAAFAYLHHSLASSDSGFSSASLVAHASGVHPTSRYVKGIANNYNGMIMPMDFTKTSNSVREINTWVGERTNSAIEGLLAERNISADTKLLLLNAIAFRGNWAEALVASAIAPGKFHSPEGPIIVDYMNATRALPVAVLYDDELDDETGENKYLASLLGIPFAEGGWEMLFFLPESLDDFLSKTTPVKFCEWLNQYDEQKSVSDAPIEIAIPKFAFSWKSGELADALKGMGVRKAFESANADFTDMASGSLCLSEIISAARIEVNEEGAKAAAASAVILGKGLPDRFALNRPFVFMLRHARSGAVTMLGKVTAPVVE